MPENQAFEGSQGAAKERQGNAHFDLLSDRPWVRIPPGSLKADNPNLFPIGDGFGLFVYFGQAPGRYYSRKSKPKPIKATEKAVPKRRGRPPKYPRDPVVTE